MLKRILIIILLGIFFVGCKSKSPIVTSKQEAIKKGNYRTGYAQKSKEDKTENVKAEKPSKKKSQKNNTPSNASESVQNIVKTAMTFEGTKYKYGGTTSKGMDCSGLVYTSFLNNEISLPRSSYDMAQYGEKIKNNKDYQVGDLIFFITGNGKRINHVGLITEITDDDVLFIHSSTQKGVIISSLSEAYYQKTFVQVNRVL
uniref:C40 family peptidase n=1 Tax=Flavobacterium sp. TaxID=239 RepID=UPI00404B9C0A